MQNEPHSLEAQIDSKLCCTPCRLESMVDSKLGHVDSKLGHVVSNLLERTLDAIFFRNYRQHNLEITIISKLAMTDLHM